MKHEDWLPGPEELDDLRWVGWVALTSFAFAGAAVGLGLLLSLACADPRAREAQLVALLETRKEEEMGFYLLYDEPSRELADAHESKAAACAASLTEARRMIAATPQEAKDAAPGEESPGGGDTEPMSTQQSSGGAGQTPSESAAAGAEPVSWQLFVLHKTADTELLRLIDEACAHWRVLPEDLCAVLWQESRLAHWTGTRVKTGDGGRAIGIGQIHRSPWQKHFSFHPDWPGGGRKVSLDLLADNIHAACGVLVYSGYDAADEAARRRAFAKYNGGPRWQSRAAQNYAGLVEALSLAIASYEAEAEPQAGDAPPQEPATSAASQDDELDLPADAPALDDADDWPLDPPFDDGLDSEQIVEARAQLCSDGGC